MVETFGWYRVLYSPVLSLNASSSTAASGASPSTSDAIACTVPVYSEASIPSYISGAMWPLLLFPPELPPPLLR